MSSREGAHCPTVAELSEQFAQTNLFRHTKKGRKPTEKQGKNSEEKKSRGALKRNMYMIG
jgi:hypothetical protein